MLNSLRNITGTTKLDSETISQLDTELSILNEMFSSLNESSAITPNLDSLDAFYLPMIAKLSRGLVWDPEILNELIQDNPFWEEELISLVSQYCMEHQGEDRVIDLILKSESRRFNRR